VGPVPNTEADSAVLRTYSDVVASRPPSVYRERPSLPLGVPAVDPDSAREPNRLNVREREDEGERSEDLATSEEVETPDKVDSRWTTVIRRRTRSLESFNNKNNKRSLTMEQTRAVKKATENMTTEQKQKVQRRQEKVRRRRVGNGTGFQTCAGHSHG
jgi:hypothetical protein